MTQFPRNIDLSNLNGVNGFRLDGSAASDRSGRSVASAGDVNGDGFDDLVVGAPLADAHGTNSGASYVVFGRAAGFASSIDMSNLDGSSGFRLEGSAANDRAGWSVASAGDVDGDGFDDLVIGAPYADPHGIESGSSYVVFGKASSFAATIDLSSLDGSSGFRLEGAAAGDNAAWSIASAGDVNGDGRDDLVVGAPHADPHGIDSGATYVVFGRASGFAAAIDLSLLDGSNGFRLDGAAAGDNAGWSVASAGDVNGDGIDDLVIGAFLADPHGIESGSSHVVFGRATGFAATIDLSSLDGSNGFRLDGSAGNNWSGWSVASAGDINGDGLDDLVVAALNADACYVVFGKAAGFAATIELSGLDGSSGFRLSAADENAGMSVASAGDVNGDGFDDLIIGADTAGPSGINAPGARSGAAYVVFGKASGFAPDIDLPSLDGSNGFKLTGAARFAHTGYSTASAGDVNGDGFADLIVGAPFAGRSGASYVIFGRAPDSAVNRVGTAASQTLAGGAFDDVLSGLGGDDKLFGNKGRDTLDGGTDDDALHGGKGADDLEGGVGDDLLTGGRGADLLAGGEGSDTFGYDEVRESSSRRYDTIMGFDASEDLFALPVLVTGIDPSIVSGRLGETDFKQHLVAAVNAATLLAHHAVLFTPDQGAHAGETFLVVDANGIAGYQSREDFVFRLDGATNLAALSTGQFS